MDSLCLRSGVAPLLASVLCCVACGPGFEDRGWFKEWREDWRERKAERDKRKAERDKRKAERDKKKEREQRRLTSTMHPSTWETAASGEWKTWAPAFDVMLVADNQQHEVSGEPTYPMSIDYLSKVMIRPSQTEWWGINTFDLALSDASRKIGAKMLAVVHLGDMADVSCKEEATTTFDSLDRFAKGRWAVAPGNHDGMFFGSYESKPGETLPASVCRSPALVPIQENAWEVACGGEANVMTKNDFIEAYLERTLGVDGITDGSWPPGGGSADAGFILRAGWHINSDYPSRSFLVQEVQLGRNVRALLIDTANYVEQERLQGFCGLVAEVGPAQQRLVEQWLAEAPEGVLHVLMGHHSARTVELFQQRSLLPSSSRETDDADEQKSRLGRILRLYGFRRNIVDLGPVASQVAGALLNKRLVRRLLANEGPLGQGSLRGWISTLNRTFGVPYYVSAHNHDVGDLVDTGEWVELNIGSTIDSPSEYWRLKGWASETGRVRLSGARTDLAALSAKTVEHGGAGCLRHEEGWRANPGDADWYMNYVGSDLKAPAEVERTLLQTQIASYERLAAYHKDGEQRSPEQLSLAQYVDGVQVSFTNKQLQTMVREAERISGGIPWAKDFKTCQVLWAAEVEATQLPDFGPLLTEKITAPKRRRGDSRGRAGWRRLSNDLPFTRSGRGRPLR